jgi:hypothetical protein
MDYIRNDYILRLYISMGNVMVVEMVNSLSDLFNDISSLNLS